MAWTHGSAEHTNQTLDYGARKLHAIARERREATARLWHCARTAGWAAVWMVLLAMLFGGVLMMAGCAGSGAAVARTRVEPGTAQREATREERRPSSMKVTVIRPAPPHQKAPVPSEDRRPVVLVRVQPERKSE